MIEIKRGLQVPFLSMTELLNANEKVVGAFILTITWLCSIGITQIIQIFNFNNFVFKNYLLCFVYELIIYFMFWLGIREDLQVATTPFVINNKD